MIYTGGHKVLSRDDLCKIDVPVRDNVGEHWKGLPHGVLADTVIDYVTRIGFGVKKETWYCNPNQSALFGAVDLDSRGTDYQLEIGQAADYSIGIRHDNAGRYAVSFAVGARITVCANGLFTGDFILKQKHTHALDVEELVCEGVEEWLTKCSEVAEYVSGMKQYDLIEEDASHIMMSTAEGLTGNRHGCLNWAHINKVAELWRKPTYDVFRPRNLWSLYNCFTEVAKTLTPPRQMKLLRGLKPIITEFTGGELN